MSTVLDSEGNSIGTSGRTIAGVVLNEDGTTVRGATVRIASSRTMVGLEAEPSATSDDAGRFDFGARPLAEYIVVAELPRFTGAFQRIDLRDPNTIANDLHLVLRPCVASIHGTIRDTAGGVVPGEGVSRSDDEFVTRGGVEADAGGAYERCVPVAQN